MSRGTNGNEEQGISIPVNAALPKRIIHAVEEVQEHRTDKARGSPIPTLPAIVRVHISPGIVLLPGIAATPDSHGNEEEPDKGGLGTDGAAEVGKIKERTQDHRADNLSEPVQETVQGPRASVEVGRINRVLLISIEPIGRPEHGEQENDVRVEFDRLPETDQLGLPGRVLHQDDSGSVTTDNLLAVAK